MNEGSIERKSLCEKQLYNNKQLELIEQLSTEKLKALVDYLNYLQDKEAWEATHELANDPEITKSLERAEADIKAGKAKALERC